jgi:hypothetical protein
MEVNYGISQEIAPPLMAAAIDRHFPNEVTGQGLHAIETIVELPVISQQSSV